MDGIDKLKEICEKEKINEGMTLRDYFAGQFILTCIVHKYHEADLYDNVANSAYKMADAMLKAR